MKLVFEVKWNNFATKFYGKEQKSFELLCYHLFCQEFNAPNGVFRYKNQAGIETDPVKKDGKLVGFQSKYYEETIKISDKKSELIDAIKKAKRKNPYISKLIFYINKEFSESTKSDEKEPEYKKEIEKAGIDENVVIEWRVKSHFEILLAREENKFVYDFFFQIEDSIWDYVNNVKKHSDVLMNRIEDCIYYKDNVLRFHNDIYEDKIKNGILKNNIVIISGDGGVGKTALIKHWMVEQDPIIFAWKGVEFNVDGLNIIFSSYGNYTFYDFVEFFKDEKNKYILIDSAERLLEIECEDFFEEFFKVMVEADWRIVFTVRTTFVKNIKYMLKRLMKRIELKEINVSKLDIEEIEQLARKNNFTLPVNSKTLDLLSIPFYLNEYLNLISVSPVEENTVKEFREELWKMKIMGYPYTKDSLDIRRKQTIIKLVKKKLENQSYYVKEDKLEQIDYTAVSELKRDEIIDYDDRQGYFIVHDIYEEWILEHIIENTFLEMYGDCIQFFQELSDAIAMRRSFRQWLLINLEDGRIEVEQLLKNIINNKEICKIWKDEVYIAVLSTKYCYKFYDVFKNNCIKNNGEIFYRLVFLLKMTEKDSVGDFLFSLPKGYGWGATIQFLYKNINELVHTDKQLELILDLLLEWNTNWSKGEVTYLASKIACEIYEKFPKLYSPNRGKVERIMLIGAREISTELSKYYEETDKGSDAHNELFERALTSFDGINLANSDPIMMINLAKRFWLLQNESIYLDQRDSWELSYGLNRSYKFDYHPQSAYQTPIYFLLRAKEKETLEFIIYITNYAIEKFVKSNMLRQYENDYRQIYIQIDGNEVYQHCSKRIWEMYRGTQTGPALLKCVFAALEKWLIEVSETKTVSEYEELLKWLLINSKSSAITAIVVSCILAKPEKTYNVAIQLLNTKEIFIFDRIRVNNERSLKRLIGISALGSRGEKEIYIMERQETMKEEFRKQTLDLVLLQYQLQPIIGMDNQSYSVFRNQIFNKIDYEREKILQKENREELNEFWELYLSQIDSRKMQVQEIKKDGNNYIAFVPELDNHVQERINENEKKMKPFDKILRLRLWAEMRYGKESEKYLVYDEYENEPLKSYEEMLQLENFKKNYSEYWIFAEGVQLYISCVLLRDFRKIIADDQYVKCREIIIRAVGDLCKYPQQIYMHGIGSEAVIEGLFIIMLENDDDLEMIKHMINYLLITKGNDFKKIIINNISKLPEEYIIYFIVVYLNVQDDYDKIARKHYYSNSKFDDTEFWKNKYQNLKDVYYNTIDLEQKIIESYSLATLSNIFQMIPSNTQESELIDIVIKLINSFLKRFEDNGNPTETFNEKWSFLDKLSEFLLYRTENEIDIYIKILNDFISKDEWTQRLLNFFIIKEDSLRNIEVFWRIWDGIYESIVSIVITEKENQINLAQKNRDYCIKGEMECENIIIEYMLASYTWNDNLKKWHTLSIKQKNLYEKMCTNLGFHRAILHGVVRVLNSIGSCFKQDGIEWIYIILSNNQWLEKQKLLTNTLFYLERYITKVIKENHIKIKQDVWFRKKLMCILDFMVEQGSVTGFMLRDEI